MWHTLNETEVDLSKACSPVDGTGVERSLIRFPIEIWCVAVFVPVLRAVLSAQAQVGTAFAYQCQLKHAGLPVSDACDFMFTLSFSTER